MTGLSLACALAGSETKLGNKRTLIVEPRSAYHQDKTWCYWQQGTTPFDDAITHRWSKWSVSSGGITHTSEHTARPYVRVDSGRFYDIAQRIIGASHAITLRLGDQAERVQGDDDGVRIHSQQGVIRAACAIDTRPQSIPQGTLLQHFLGWEIDAEADVFDPTTVTLMDFVPGAQDVHFFYVLPFSPRRALVETTHFSMALQSDEDYRRELTDYLQARYGLKHWQITRTEQGVIPMPRRQPRWAGGDHGRVIPMGLHADTTKPSTGYCYPHAQDQARRQAENLLQDKALRPSAARSKLSRWFDSVFIGFLEQHPQRAGAVFLALFQRVPPDALLRFLNDEASLGDYIQVMLALPKATFIKQAFRHAWGA